MASPSISESILLNDAVQLYLESKCAKGQLKIKGPSEYQNKYVDIAIKLKTALPVLLKSNEIQYKTLSNICKGSKCYIQQGIHLEGKPGPDIEINRNNLKPNETLYYKPEKLSKKGKKEWYKQYLQSADKLAGTSLVLVHECLHRLAKMMYFEEELCCRTFELLYYRELKEGVTFLSSYNDYIIIIKLDPLIQDISLDYEVQLKNMIKIN